MAELYLIDSDNNLTALSQADYDSEDLLQTLLGDHPQLLGGDQMGAGVPRQWLFVTREAGVPDKEGGGSRWSLDHLFLDQDAIPTFVEVKRASDSRIRREVVGQMLDYAANGLRYWPVEQIQSFLASRIGDVDEALVQAFGEDVDSAQYWQRLHDNISDGRVRLLFVADKIPDELLAVVEFLNKQMDHTEVLAVEVPQFVGEDLRTLAPRVLGKSQEAEQRKRQYRKSKDPRPEFQAIIDAFDREASDGMRTTGRASGYRQIRIPGWPDILHYELMDRGGGNGPRASAEIHLESEDYDPIREHLERLHTRLSEEFPETEYSDRWFKGCRVAVFVPMEDPGAVTETMNRLITETRESIQSAIDEL